jgi:molybdopterin-guanine dinucleotide biosynthesis protein A
MTKRAALILAGGKARRFQAKGAVWEDKALAPLSGKPLLIHAVHNVQGVVDEVAVSVNDEERAAKYTEILKKHAISAVRIVVDEKNGIGGPTVAIMSGLRSVQAPYCLTLPCDMPFLKPKIADYLFRQAEGFDVAVPMWPNGRLETLLTVLQKQNGLEITETLCKLNRPRSDDIQRGAGKILLASTVDEIKTFDPELKSFININSKEDLNLLQTRRAHGPVKKNLQLNLGALSISDLQRLREGARMVQEEKFSQAESTFALCASNFEVCNQLFWAAVSWENQGEALLKLSTKQVEAKAAAEVDFMGKEAFLKAANGYRLEAEMHEENRCMLLAQRAWADKSWSESWAMGKHSHVHRYPSKVAKD